MGQWLALLPQHKKSLGLIPGFSQGVCLFSSTSSPCMPKEMYLGDRQMGRVHQPLVRSGWDTLHAKGSGGMDGSNSPFCSV